MYGYLLEYIFCFRIKNSILPENAENTLLGQSFKLKCEKEYKILGSNEVICQEDGTWLFPLPKCVPKTCPEPPEVENGLVKVSKIHTQKP